MPSNLWPNSATRKMYGKKGFEQQIRNQKESFTSKIKHQSNVYRSAMDEMIARVRGYESLKWYKKLWLAILELFGYKISILPKQDSL